MAEYASSAASNGIKVLIAAAGGAAHLPGMVAAYTELPVIGVPVKPSIGDGMDSLLSISNMPKGVPVATVGLNNSTNAALLAARVLGSSISDLNRHFRSLEYQLTFYAGDLDVRKRVRQYISDSDAEVREKDRKLFDMGEDEYAEKALAKK